MSKSKGLFGEILDPVSEGLFGGNTDSEEKKRKAELDAAAAQINGLKAPEIGDINFDNYDWLGDYKPTSMVSAPTIAERADVNYEGVDPRLAELFLADDSDFNDISVDPRLRDDQMASLDALKEISEGGGLRASDRAALGKIQSDAAQADKGRRDAIVQNMSARGMGGGGMDLLAQLQSSQAATDRTSQAGLDIAGQAQDRELAAIMQSGQLAGSIRGQEFGEDAEVAAANDAITKFNAANSNQNAQWNAGTWNDVGLANAGNQLKTDFYNTDKGMQTDFTNAGFAFDANKFNSTTANDASKANWQGKQATANANKDLGHKSLVHNKITTPQTNFDNATTLARLKAGSNKSMADYWKQQGDAVAAKAAARAATTEKIVGAAPKIVGAAPKIAGAAATMASDKRVKKDIGPLSDEDLDDFLKSINPKKFKYKNPSKPDQAEGDRLGFLLQDVQGTKIGKALTIKADDGHLAYDKDNLDGVILAALSSIAKGKKAS